MSHTLFIIFVLLIVFMSRYCTEVPYVVYALPSVIYSLPLHTGMKTSQYLHLMTAAGWQQTYHCCICSECGVEIVNDVYVA